MNDRARRPTSGPPHNPDLRDLVADKRRFSSPPNQQEAMCGFRGWHERGYLPHRDQPGLTQFVTFHLADSYPAALRSEWAHLLAIENDRERRTKLEGYLDQGRGDCHLRRPEIAELMQNSLLLFHRRRYQLRAWVIMPNHVHVLLSVGETPLSVIVGNWKKHTARLANQLLRREGDFWAQDYWDTFMRDAPHEKRTVSYIESNPSKAKFVRDPREWPWSSARRRDGYGCLTIGADAEAREE